MLPYNDFSTYLKDKYKTKIYKLPIKLRGSCPNRDGTISYGGCHFCGEEGGSFENLSEELSVTEQLRRNRAYISKKFNAKGFIAYFQNYTNTYMDYDKFVKTIDSVVSEDIVAIYISTRPDCVTDAQLEYLSGLYEEYGVDIVLELGLQTANYHNLYGTNRGHGLAEFIACVIKCKRYGISVCTHVIIGLPGDEELDVIETARIITALGVDQVKLHALYISKSSKYGKLFQEGKITTITKEQFIERAILFLRYLGKDIIIQRLLGRIPEQDSLFSNWSTSWWLIRDQIVEKMCQEGYRQGDLCDLKALEL